MNLMKHIKILHRVGTCSNVSQIVLTNCFNIMRGLCEVLTQKGIVA